MTDPVAVPMAMPMAKPRTEPKTNTATTETNMTMSAFAPTPKRCRFRESASLLIKYNESEYPNSVRYAMPELSLVAGILALLAELSREHSFLFLTS
jgi:hypothetical protein